MAIFLQPNRLFVNFITFYLPVLQIIICGCHHFVIYFSYHKNYKLKNVVKPNWLIANLNLNK